LVTPAGSRGTGLWERRSLRSKALIAVALPVFAMLVGAAGILTVTHDTQQASQRSGDQLQSEVALQQLLSQVLVADSSMRGYLASGDTALLKRYKLSVQRLPGALRVVNSTTPDDTSQADRLTRLDTLVRRETRSLAALGAKPSTSPVVRQSSARLNRIQSLVDDTVQAAQKSQKKYEAVETRSQTRTVMVGLGTAALGLLGGLAAVLLLSTYVIRRVELVRDNAARLASGERLQPIPEGGDELSALNATLEQTAAVLADKESLVELSLEAGGLILFEAQEDGTVAMRGEPDLLHSLGVADDQIGSPTVGAIQEALVAGGGGDQGPRWDTGDVALTTTNGEECLLDVRSRAVHGPDGKPTGVVVGVASDVTARVHARRAVEEAKEKAEHANRAKDEFLSRVSHELRTPLNAVLGFAQLMEMDDLGEEHGESVEHILKGGRHLLALVNEMLDLARIDSGQLSLSVEPTGVYDVMADAVRLMRPIASDHNVRVVVISTDDGRLHVLADQQRLKQVVLNLLSNAVKYNRAGGSVTVAWERTPEDWIKLTVGDTGTGIPEKQLSRLFKPFERLGAQQSGIEGTGLGLALSKGLVEAMGGQLALEATGSEGTTFSVFLPMAEPLPTSVDPALAQGYATNLPDMKQLSVLYIEDNLTNLQLVEELLLRAGARAPLLATRGHLGIQLASAHRPDLILLDRHLPDMLGEDVLKSLRLRPETARIPVVVISADVMGSMTVMQEAGADALLTKPIDVESFWRAVRSALGGTGLNARIGASS
jgi:signal transduction histidine kinase/CHASE3 domain sensor protein/ActR/RegA family two-component response regulator